MMKSVCTIKYEERINYEEEVHYFDLNGYLKTTLSLQNCKVPPSFDLKQTNDFKVLHLKFGPSLFSSYPYLLPNMKYMANM